MNNDIQSTISESITKSTEMLFLATSGSISQYDPSKAITYNESAKSYTKLISTIVKRFEIYDNPIPTKYIVGFLITNKRNGQKKYVETTINYDVSLSDSQVCQKAYQILKDKIILIKKELIESRSVVGTEFIPEEYEDR